MTAELRTATTRDLDAIRELLAASALPVDDLETSRPAFVVATQGDRVVGVGGVEQFDTTGLLRSLTVHGDQRGRGLGQRLVHELEERARASGIRELLLLTTTAEDFFRNLGYAAIERASIAGPVLNSAEFRSLCPQSARCMCKRLVES
jgi:amino-acid N-acetyltransferase